MASSTHLALRAALFAAFAFVASGPARAQDLARGKELFVLCAQCHGPEGAGNREFLAPTIAGLPDWYVSRQLHAFHNGWRGLQPDDRGGLRMYPMSLALKTDADIEAVAAYVASLPRTHPAPVLSGGDAAKGAATWAVCTACHGPEAAGNQAVGAPPLRWQSDWYLLTSLQKFKAGIRGNNPKDAPALTMRGMAATLADDQAMKDVIAYIGSLANQAAAADTAPAQNPKP
jgi:cytochrome c oxidase subunit 2